MFIIISDRCNVQHGQLAACAACGAASVAWVGGTRIMHSHIRISTHIRISHSLGNYCLPRFKRPFYFILCERTGEGAWAWAYLIFIHCTNAYFACLSCLPIIHLHLFFTACFIFFVFSADTSICPMQEHRHVFIAYLKAQLIEHD